MQHRILINPKMVNSDGRLNDDASAFINNMVKRINEIRGVEIPGEKLDIEAFEKFRRHVQGESKLIKTKVIK